MDIVAIRLTTHSRGKLCLELLDRKLRYIGKLAHDIDLAASLGIF